MNDQDSILVLRGAEVRQLLSGQHRQVIEAVRRAYCDHQAGLSCLPHSVFVRFPGRQKERIIALPAYLGGEREVAGIKWISSFPGNLERGISRASAIMVLNSLVTGRPEAIMEGSLISAARTAASAALAADVLHAPGDIDVLGVIGCGLINREIVRYICSLNRGIGAILAFDIDRERADAFGRAVGTLDRKIDYEVCASTEDLISRASVISFATTAVEPSVPRISVDRKGTTILHISLRDLTPAAILEADNVVDDVDHVMRAQTSVHLAEQQVGHRRFVRCTLAEVLAGAQPPRRDATSTVVFSPFGLGVLDLAVASLVMRRGASSGTGTKLQEFFAGT